MLEENKITNIEDNEVKKHLEDLNFTENDLIKIVICLALYSFSEFLEKKCKNTED